MRELIYRNEELYNAIRSYSTIKNLAELSKSSYNVINAMLNFKRKYVFTKSNTFTKPALNLLAFLGIDPRDMQKAYENQPEEEQEIPKLEDIPSNENIEEKIAEKQYLEILFKRCKTLTEKEEKIINHYFYDGKNYVEIGNIYNVSRTRIEQLINSGLRKLAKTAKYLNSGITFAETNSSQKEPFWWEKTDFLDAIQVSQEEYFKTPIKLRLGAASENGKARSWYLKNGIPIYYNDRDASKNMDFYDNKKKKLEYFYIKSKKRILKEALEKRRYEEEQERIRVEEEKKQKEKEEELQRMKNMKNWTNWKYSEDYRLFLLEEYAKFLNNKAMEDRVKKERDRIEEEFIENKHGLKKAPATIKPRDITITNKDIADFENALLEKEEKDRKHYLEFLIKISRITKMEEKVLRDFFITGKSIEQLEEKYKNEQIWLYKKNGLKKFLEAKNFLDQLLKSF